MSVQRAQTIALRSAITPSAVMSATVRMDTDWTQMDSPAMVCTTLAGYVQDVCT